ncbi:hypothetical protein ON010_g15078 [Phytophthora cinnamomi]|nr:hypothetical protein ON010_g15078 [Phytophthora cinnamomi]
MASMQCSDSPSPSPKPVESQEPTVGITQNPLFRHQAALTEQLIQVNQKLDVRVAAMEDAFYKKTQRKRQQNDTRESITDEPPAKRKRPSAEAEDELEWSAEDDLSEKPLHDGRKVLDRKRLNRETYYLVNWEPTGEPREHVAQTLIAGFERERRALVRKTYIEYEVVEDSTLNKTEG